MTSPNEFLPHSGARPGLASPIDAARPRPYLPCVMTEGMPSLSELNERSRESLPACRRGLSRQRGTRGLAHSDEDDVGTGFGGHCPERSCRTSSTLDFSEALMFPPAGCLPRPAFGCFVDGLLEVGDLTEADRDRHRQDAGVERRRCGDAARQGRLGPLGRYPWRESCARTEIRGPDSSHRVRLAGTGPCARRARLCRWSRREPGLPTASRTDSGIDAGSRQLPQRNCRGPHAFRTRRRRPQGDQRPASGTRRSRPRTRGDRAGDLGERRSDPGASDRAGEVEFFSRRGAESEELERIRTLFDDLERKRDIAEFLDLTQEGDGVRIFIGSENKLFSLSGSSLVVSPYMNSDRKIIGAVGVIGPTRLNYGRIVPIGRLHGATRGQDSLRRG